MDKKILVFGATGQQGSAAVKQLLDNGFKVKAFTRDHQSAKAKQLQSLGAEIFEGSLENEIDIVNAMDDIYGTFLVLPPQWAPTQQTDEAEWLTGKLIIDCAKQANVQQIVYSSVMGSELQVSFRPLFKHTIESYLIHSGIKYTILKPAVFYENFYLPNYGLDQKLIYNPLPADMQLPFISVEDIGVFARLAFQQPEAYNGKVLNITGELLTSADLAAAFSKALGVEITPIEIPVEAIKQQNELLGLFMEALHIHGYPKIDVNEFRNLHPSILSLNQWIEEYGKEKLLTIVE